MKNELTTARLRELFTYDPEDGHLRRVKDTGGGPKAGDIAGGLTQHGYLQLYVDEHNYLVHRLVWLHVHERWPAEYLDHVNGIKSDNRLTNLREASHAENHQNLGLRSTNKSGFPGVSWDQSRGKWKAQITRNRKNRLVGRFDVAEDAASAYRAAKRRLHTFAPEGREIAS